MKRLLVISLLTAIIVPSTVAATFPKPQVNKQSQSKAVTKNINKKSLPSDTAFNWEARNTFLQQRLDKLGNATFIPENKRAELESNILSDIAWFKDYSTRQQAASTEAEREALRQELIDHLRDKQSQRKNLINENLQLPKISPIERAQAIDEHLQTVLEKLKSTGADITNVQTLYDNYKAAQEQLQSDFTQAQSNHTIDDMRTVHTDIAAVRTALQNLRNQIESIVGELKQSN